MSLPHSKNRGEGNRRDFYHIAIHFVFAIVIAQSFTIASEILIPIHSAFTNEKFLISASLFLSYIITISGWVGYARSISVKPHKDDIKGAIRFILDLVVLFEYFYLLQLSRTAYFAEQFLWIVLIIFSTYFIWDIIKYFEYKRSTDRKFTRNRASRTLSCLAICLIITLAYHFLVIEESTDLEIFKNKDAQLFFFISLTGILIIGYRIWKWGVRRKKTPMPK